MVSCLGRTLHIFFIRNNNLISGCAGGEGPCGHGHLNSLSVAHVIDLLRISPLI